ncbi:MAG: hypothetical protein AAF085_16685, partial [Planctomycetota bacterium]
FMAEPLHWLLTHRDGIALREKCELRGAPRKEYYESHLAVFRDMPNDFLDVSQSKKDGLLLAIESGQLSERDAYVLPFLKPELRLDLIEQSVGIDGREVEEVVSVLAEDHGKGTLPEWETERLLENPAVRFVIRLVLPAFALYRQTPQGLYQRATDTADPDLDSMRCIARHDVAVVSMKSAAPVIYDGSDDEIADRLRWVVPDPDRRPQPPTLKEVKHRMAGFLSYAATYLGIKLESPDIRALFNIRAKQLGSRYSYDIHLPDGGSFRKMLYRERLAWDAHFKADTNLTFCVRATVPAAA